MNDLTFDVNALQNGVTRSADDGSFTNPSGTLAEITYDLDTPFDANTSPWVASGSVELKMPGDFLQGASLSLLVWAKDTSGITSSFPIAVYTIIQNSNELEKYTFDAFGQISSLNDE